MNVTKKKLKLIEKPLVKNKLLIYNVKKRIYIHTLDLPKRNWTNNLINANLWVVLVQILYFYEKQTERNLIQRWFNWTYNKYIQTDVFLKEILYNWQLHILMTENTSPNTQCK